LFSCFKGLLLKFCGLLSILLGLFLLCGVVFLSGFEFSSLVAYERLLLFLIVDFCVRLACYGQAGLPQPIVANLDLRSSDPIGRAEEKDISFASFSCDVSFGRFASYPHCVLSPAHFGFGLAGYPLDGFVCTQCWELMLVLFFVCSCVRLCFCILVSFRELCFVFLL